MREIDDILQEIRLKGYEEIGDLLKSLELLLILELLNPEDEEKRKNAIEKFMKDIHLILKYLKRLV